MTFRVTSLLIWVMARKCAYKHIHLYLPRYIYHHCTKLCYLHAVRAGKPLENSRLNISRISVKFYIVTDGQMVRAGV